MDFKGFIGQSYTLKNVQYECQRTVNWYPEVDETGLGKDAQITHFLDVDGLTLAVEEDEGVGADRGLYQTSLNTAFTVIGSKLYQLNGSRPPFVLSEIGTLETNRGIVRFADNGRYVVLVDGNNGYSYDMTGEDGFDLLNTQEAWQGATHVDYLDGYFVFNRPGTNIFYWTNPNTVTLNGLNFERKNGSPDPIAGLVVSNRNLWLIGTQTTEVWNNSPSGNRTFVRVPGPFIESGTPAPFTITKTGNGAFWVAQDKRGGAYVVSTGGGYQPVPVSTQAVALALQAYRSLAGSTAFAYQKDGHAFYVINPKNGTSSWVYDNTTSLLLQQPTWHERTYTNEVGIQSRALPDNHCFFKGYHLVGDYREVARIYYLDDTNATDNGATITRDRITPHLASNLDRLFHHLLELDAEVGVGQPAIGVVPIPTCAVYSLNTVQNVEAPIIEGTQNEDNEPFFEFTVPTDDGPVEGKFIVAVVLVSDQDGGTLDGAFIDDVEAEVAIIQSELISGLGMSIIAGHITESADHTIRVTGDFTPDAYTVLAKIYTFGNAGGVFYQKEGTGFGSSFEELTIDGPGDISIYGDNVMMFSAGMMENWDDTESTDLAQSDPTDVDINYQDEFPDEPRLLASYIGFNQFEEEEEKFAIARAGYWFGTDTDWPDVTWFFDNPNDENNFRCYLQAVGIYPICYTPPPTPPDPPELLSVTPLEEHAFSATLLVEWEEAEPGSSPVASYSVFRARGGDAPTQIDSVPANQLSYVDTVTEPGWNYTYVITAVDENDSESEPSNEEVYSYYNMTAGALSASFIGWVPCFAGQGTVDIDQQLGTSDNFVYTIANTAPDQFNIAWQVIGATAQPADAFISVNFVDKNGDQRVILRTDANGPGDTDGTIFTTFNCIAQDDLHGRDWEWDGAQYNELFEVGGHYFIEFIGPESPSDNVLTMLAGVTTPPDDSFGFYRLNPPTQGSITAGDEDDVAGGLRLEGVYWVDEDGFNVFMSTGTGSGMGPDQDAFTSITIQTDQGQLTFDTAIADDFGQDFGEGYSFWTWESATQLFTDGESYTMTISY